MSLDNPTRYLWIFDTTDDNLSAKLTEVLEASEIQWDTHDKILKVLRWWSIMQLPDGFSIAREGDTIVRLYEARVGTPESRREISPAERRGRWAITSPTRTTRK